MSVTETRVFEITATVNFPTLAPTEHQSFVEKLESAVGAVLVDYPTAVAFLLAPGDEPGDVMYGVRFKGADPKYITEMADEILQRSVDLVAQREGTSPLEAEREESVLVLA